MEELLDIADVCAGAGNGRACTASHLALLGDLGQDLRSSAGTVCCSSIRQSVKTVKITSVTAFKLAAELSKETNILPEKSNNNNLILITVMVAPEFRKATHTIAMVHRCNCPAKATQPEISRLHKDVHRWCAALKEKGASVNGAGLFQHAL